MPDIGKVSDLTQVPSIFDFLKRNELEMTGLRRAAKMVMIEGYPKEQFVVKFKEGAYPFVNVGKATFLFEDGEKDRIEADLLTTILPLAIPYTNDTMPLDCPPEIKRTVLDPRAWKNIDWSVDDVLCPIHNEDGNVILIEQRYKTSEGEKICIRWTYHDDFVWRNADPDVFPFWGMDQLQNGAHTIILHEGPKAASAGRFFHEVNAAPMDKRKAIRDHPWYDVFSLYPHLGWIGGANRAARSMWKQLKKIGVKRVIVIPDADAAGRQSAYDIAGFLEGIEVSVLPDYPDSFPLGWDFADGFAVVNERREKAKTQRVSVGDWEGLPYNLNDITRMTIEYPITDKKMGYRLVPGFPKNIAYMRNTDTFTLKGRPDISIPWDKLPHVYAGNIHSGAMASFSKMVAGNPSVHYDKFAFEPEMEAEFSMDGDRQLNTWRPTTIEPLEMDEKGWEMWNWYLDQLVPDPIENALSRRWIATVIDRPRRKHFGLLIHTTTQGTGKTTLYDMVLKPIIGKQFCATPSADDLDSRFTDWKMNKTLIYADEVAGNKKLSSSDIYNKFKTWMTSPETRIEEKGKPVFTISDWAKVLINSNKDVPIFMEGSDRRWLIARGGETMMTTDQAEALRAWLKADGCRMILWWARNLADDPKAAIAEGAGDDEFRQTMRMPYQAGYIPDGANAPMTSSKSAMRKKGTGVHHQAMMEILDQLDNFGDTPLALPSVVVEDAVMNMMKNEYNSKLKRSTVSKELFLGGWWQAKASHNMEGFPNPIRATIEGVKGRKRFVYWLNDAAIKMVMADGWDGIEIVNPTTREYKPTPFQYADGSIDYNFDRLKARLTELGILRNMDIWADDGDWRFVGDAPIEER